MDLLFAILHELHVVAQVPPQLGYLLDLHLGQFLLAAVLLAELQHLGRHAGEFVLHLLAGLLAGLQLVLLLPELAVYVEQRGVQLGRNQPDGLALAAPLVQPLQQGFDFVQLDAHFELGLPGPGLG